jgi:MGT family glycosyltransferase
MAKYAFFCIPAYGHVLPTLSLVAELVSRGERVIYYMTDEHKDSIEAAGAELRDFPSFISVQGEEKERAFCSLVDSLRTERVDFIIYDFFFTWGSLLARALQVPAINVRSTYANNRHFSMSARHQYRSRLWSSRDDEYSVQYSSAYLDVQQRAEISKIFNVPVPTSDDPFDVYSAGEVLNICMIPRMFQLHAETFDECHIFVGFSTLSRPDNGGFAFEALDGRPLLYISLGTLFNNRADIFKSCIKAFGQTDWQVVLSRGRQSAPFALGPVPANFLVVNYAPQLELLARTSIFISHGGMNSIIESIMAGVPTISIPQISEHAINAENTERFGLGIALSPQEVTADQLRDAVERITHNRSYYEKNIQATRSTIQGEGGCKRAVDAIVALKGNVSYVASR